MTPEERFSGPSFPLGSRDRPSRDEVEIDVPPGVRVMALVRWALIGLMAVLAALSVAYSFGLLPSSSASAASVQYYCPMHPQVVQDHPGECPICSMTLVKKAEGKAPQDSPGSSPDSRGGASREHAGHRHESSDPYFCPMHQEETAADASTRCPICGMKLERRPQSEEPSPKADRPPAEAPVPAAPINAQPPTAQSSVPGLVPINLSFERVQNIGVRTAPAMLETLDGELRTVGFVSADESRLARVHTRFSGWIEQLDVATTGQKVARGQRLAALYSPDLLPAQQEYLSARGWTKSTGASVGAGNSMDQDARARLELLGVSSAEIEHIAATGKPLRAVGVAAPISGYVINKNAIQGAFVQPGTELFEIADLSRVWVLADVYEYDVGRVHVGQGAKIAVAAYPGESFAGKVGFLYPVIEPSTRTLRVRVEIDNAGMKLRPGMYADATLRLDAARAVVISAEALIDTGDHQYVFLAREGGRFEPRQVGVGHRFNDKVQISNGLVAGDVVVTTANFLLDSESRLHAAIQGPDPHADPLPRP